MTMTPSDASGPRPVDDRRRAARRRAKAADRTARVIITLGGLGVIGAVLGILVFLTSEVLPLFDSGKVTETWNAAPEGAGERVVSAAVDEHVGLGVLLTESGLLRTVYLEDGRALSEPVGMSPEGKRATAIFHDPIGGALGVGFDDGSLRLGTIGFTYDFVDVGTLPESFGDSEVGSTIPHEGGCVTHSGPSLYRWTRPTIELNPPTDPTGSAVRRIHYLRSSGNEFIAVARDDGSVTFNKVRITRPLGGGEPRVRLTATDVEFRPPAGVEPLPDWLYATATGDSLFAIWKSGLVQRYGVAEGERLPTVLCETVDLGIDAPISQAAMLFGGRTLLVGTSDGTTLGVFTTSSPTAGTPDLRESVVAHRFGSPSGAGVTSFSISGRDRSFATGFADGSVIVRHMTSAKTVLRPTERTAGAVEVLVLTPKFDGLLALGRGVPGAGGNTDETGASYRFWSFDPRFPEASLRSLFGKVWYEGEGEPQYSYQSSSGSDTTEVKLSLTPLIFGTLKATVFAMLFAAPLGILAAIYASEFLHPRVRSAVKPTIEAMASLPSVVLGFITAMVIAPHARDWLPGILLAFAVVPLSVLLAAHLWQMMPVRYQSRLPSWAHMSLVAVTFLGSLVVSIQAGGLFERALFQPRPADRVFLAWSAAKSAAALPEAERDIEVPADYASWVEPVPVGARPSWLGERETLGSDDGRRLQAEGMYFQDGQVYRPVAGAENAGVNAVLKARRIGKADIRYWLDGVIGGSWPGWFLLATPVGFILTSLLKGRFVEPALRQVEGLRTGPHVALFELIKFLITIVVALALAAVLAGVLAASGLDPRDSIFGTYTQRNTMIVGMVMGFAVIPIIFTIAEDALGSVPTSLRSASLGAGATRWQTATRVVLPVAASGIFSATMIGLGRAVGETMIVLMATGNTATMSPNIFEGFRTLAANIAVELPEAPQGLTHYRVLFLCGLVLFVMTFLINTTAEIVRQRFRRRSAAL